MAINVIELAGADLVKGLVTIQGTITFEELVERFGFARANQLWKECSFDGLFMDFGGGGGCTPSITTGYLLEGGSPAAATDAVASALELAESTEITATSTSMTTVGQGALVNGQGTAQLTSVMTMDIGVVGAAVAPVLGVALGASLYQDNPEFWTRLSQKLLPFCYPGTTEIPGWIDVVETLTPDVYEANTVIDKRVYDAIKEFFEAEGIVDENRYSHEGSVTVDNRTITGPIQEIIIPSSTASVPIGVGPQGNIVYVVNKSGYNLHYTLDTTNNKIIFAYEGNAPARSVIIHTNMPEGGGWSSWSGNASSWTYSSNTVYYGTWDNIADYGTGELLIARPRASTVSGLGDSSYTYRAIAWYLLFGSFASSIVCPTGTSEWDGDQGSDDEYDKDIIYMKYDPDTNTWSIDTKSGLPVAVPSKPIKKPSTKPISKPDNWPEGLDWPIEIDFPWNKPAGYDGDWPDKMPWPLPENKPDWWPSIIPYPNNFPYPIPSLNSSDNPDPNKNEDNKKPIGYVISSSAGTETDPKDEDDPDPDEDPSKKKNKPKKNIINPYSDGPTPIPPPPPTIDDGQTPIPPVIPIVDVPFSSQNDGLITVYHPTAAQLKSFASWLWVTYADPSIDKLWNNPFDGIIGLMELYCTPTDVGTKSIRCGFLDSGITSATISRYTTINCGSITVPEFYGNYLDYSPYSKCHIYLPFIGLVELNVDDIVGHAVNVTYRIDEYNGSCIAQITVAKHTEISGTDIDYSSLMYQYSGNCAVELPIAGGTQSAIRAGLIQAAAYGLSSVIGGIASGATGNIGGAISQVGYGAANAIGSAVSAKSSVQHSGSFGSSYGALGVKIPYIVVSRPKQLIVPGYTSIYGYPAHKMVTIGSCEGYLRVREVNVRSATASDEEKKRIEELLKEGVYVT